MCGRCEIGSQYRFMAEIMHVANLVTAMLFVNALKVGALRGISPIVLPHMRISAHTRMGRPIRVWDIPYAYGPI